VILSHTWLWWAWLVMLLLGAPGWWV